MKEKSATNEIRRRLSFESYGARIGIRSESENILRQIENRIAEILPGAIKFIDSREAEHFLDVERKGEFGFAIYKDGENVSNAADERTFFDFIESQIRLAVAEFAVGRVFLHAGAVGWKGRGVIIPASSFAGKSALVAALIKKGALYYSDEYAVLDEDGRLHPFPKPLSLRGVVDDYRQVERTAQSLGGAVGETPIPVALALICAYKKGGAADEEFAPEILSAGRGMLEILAHTIPVRYNTKFALEILNKISTRAIIAKCKRGEADVFANLLIQFLDKAF